MVDQTAEESKKSNIAKMGEPLGTLYSALWQHVAVMFVHWLEYVELFGTKPSRIDVLNRAAPHFFRMIQDALWDVALLHLARITDPAFSGKDKPNLSIQALPSLVSDPKLNAEVQNAVGIALSATNFARDWRNRLIAHRDLKLALEQPTAPLADETLRQVSDALKSLEALLNVLARYYFDSETRFDLVPRRNGSISLLYVLRAGIKSQDERDKRFQEGKATDADFHPEEI